MRTLTDVFEPGAKEYPIEIEERHDIDTEVEVYREAIKKIKFSSKDNGKVKMMEIGQFSVYSN